MEEEIDESDDSRFIFDSTNATTSERNPSYDDEDDTTLLIEGAINDEDCSTFGQMALSGNDESGGGCGNKVDGEGGVGGDRRDPSKGSQAILYRSGGKREVHHAASRKKHHR